jgi:predicted outer membrane protein
MIQETIALLQDKISKLEQELKGYFVSVSQKTQTLADDLKEKQKSYDKLYQEEQAELERDNELSRADIEV